MNDDKQISLGVVSCHFAHVELFQISHFGVKAANVTIENFAAAPLKDKFPFIFRMKLVIFSFVSIRLFDQSADEAFSCQCFPR